MKMRWKKFLAMGLSLAMLFGLTACSSGTKTETPGESAPAPTEAPADGEEQAEASVDARILMYSEANSADSLDGLLAEYFREQVVELSGGTLDIDIQASGVLGNQGDVLDGMVANSGTVDMARISCFDLSNYGGKISTMLGLPYTFTNREHFWNFVDSEIGQKILNEPADLQLGIRGLFYVEEGFRSFFFSDNVSGVGDISGKKIRVSSDPILVGVVESLGASATVISFNELYTSLQSGVVDGAEQPLVAYESNVFYEVAPYFVEDGHTFSASEIVISDATWNSLTEEQQNALTEAGRLTEEHCKELSASMEEECRERLTEAGVTFVEVTDKGPWQEACQSIIEEYVSDNKDAYQQILDAAN